MSAIHYQAATKRTFKQAIIFLLEHEYKLLGSHRVLEMIADDIVELQAEFYQDANQVPPGHLVWHGTLDVGRKQPYGQRAEDEPSITAILPLITRRGNAGLPKRQATAYLVTRAGYPSHCTTS